MIRTNSLSALTMPHNLKRKTDLSITVMKKVWDFLKKILGACMADRIWGCHSSGFSCADQRKDIVISDDNRKLFLAAVGQVSERFELDIFVKLMMGTHYHLLFGLQRAKLCKSKQWFGATQKNPCFDLAAFSGNVRNVWQDMEHVFKLFEPLWGPARRV